MAKKSKDKGRTAVTDQQAPAMSKKERKKEQRSQKKAAAAPK